MSKSISRLAAAVITLTVSQAALADSKTVGPSQCQPYGQSSSYDTLAIRADGVQNKTTNTNKYVICPLDRDAESSWTAENGMAMIVYFVYTGNGTIQCTLTVGTDVAGVDDGPVAVSANAVPYVGNLWAIQFEERAGESFQPATMTCRLPPQAKLSFYQYSEDTATNPAPPAP
jgi:hypothetical protein